MRVAVFGGSFDPPHIGHAMIVQWLILSGTVDEVWLTPTFQHALKDRTLSPWKDRCDWVDRLARAIGHRTVCCTIEDTLPQPSYTINTLEALTERYPGRDFRLVIGADILYETYRWHRWEDIEAKFNPIVMGRAGFPMVPGSPAFPKVSSTMIRKLLVKKKREEAAVYVPKLVMDVLPHGLYW